MIIKNKTVLIAGSSGFIGQHLSYALHGAGAKVVGLGRKINHSYPHDYYSVNILDRPAIREIIHAHKPEFLVNLVSNKSAGFGGDVSREGYETSLLGSLNLIESCQEIPHFSKYIFIGSAEEYGLLQPPYKETDKEMPATGYGVSKLAVTEFLMALSRAGQFCGVILRPTVVYGPGQDDNMFLPSLIKSLVLGKKFNMTLGEQTRDFIYVTDLVHAIMRALVVPGLSGQVLNISSAKPIRIDFLAKLTANILGNGAENLLNIGALGYRKFESMEYFSSNCLAKNLLGWAPSVSIEDGIMRTINYYRHLVRDS